MPSGIWRPLLDGHLAARAEDAVRDLADALAVGLSNALPEQWSLGSCLGGSGAVDLALFYGYLARTANGEAHAHAQRADRSLDHALETLTAAPLGAALYGGFTAVAWAAEHLSPSEAGEDMSEVIDETLLTALAAPWTGHYDLISGVVGFGVYALERVPRHTALSCLEAIVDYLDRTAVSVGAGVAWFTPPDLLPARNRKETPNGYYNLGVAHGVPGVIALLADACRLGIRADTARPLLEDAVRWVLSHRLSARAGACYPALVAADVQPVPSRLAWCYGDPGVAATLLYAARAVGREDWERTALDIAVHAASAAPEESGVRDAGLCHGALGLAHINNRIYQASGDELFADAARRWYRLGLDMRQPEGGIAGFEAMHLRPDQQMGWITDPGFLTGATGIGLALLAGFTSVEPNWDRLLMVAIPPRPHE